jgi:benzoyl-CoA reductase/2-hydroxyglutaryl-CoA dehydratase subunit BcrC/BadD/HgdB
MLRVVVPDRGEVIREWTAGGGRIAAVFPIHYPRALLRAFGLLPVEVWGPPGVDPGAAGRHLQGYVCTIVRHGLAFLLEGGLDEAALLLAPHACDSLQGLGSVLLDFVRPAQPVLTLYLPRGRRESDRWFLAEELRRLSGRLVELTGRDPGEAELHAAIDREEAADRVLGELLAGCAGLGLSNAAFYELVRAREYLPAERFVALAGEVAAGAGGGEPEGIPVVLSGIVPEPRELVTALDALGARVVGDDLACCGRRCYPPAAGEDPFLRMAARLLGGPPCSTRGNAIAERLERLRDLVARGGARGVIFLVIKFCEPELFDLPALRKGLQASGVPSLVLELELGLSLPAQAENRLAAFLEMLA